MGLVGPRGSRTTVGCTSPEPWRQQQGNGRSHGNGEGLEEEPKSHQGLRPVPVPHPSFIRPVATRGGSAGRAGRGKGDEEESREDWRRPSALLSFLRAVPSLWPNHP